MFDSLGIFINAIAACLANIGWKFVLLVDMALAAVGASPPTSFGEVFTLPGVKYLVMTGMPLFASVCMICVVVKEERKLKAIGLAARAMKMRPKGEVEPYVAGMCKGGRNSTGRD